MDIQLCLYQLMTNTGLPDFPGKWRFKRYAKELVNNRYYQVPYLSGSIWVCPVHAMGRQVFAGEIYEPTLVDVVRQFVHAQFSFIDIGANIGLHTVAAALARVNDSQFFIAFEPEPVNFSWLLKNCQANNLSFVTCKQKALGEKDDFLVLNISTTLNKGNHSLLAREGTVRGTHVPVERLDTFFAGFSCSADVPVLIKLDVEGFEWPVVAGAIQFLTEKKEIALICEVTPKNLTLFGKSVKDLQDYLKDAGFAKSAVLIDQDSFAAAGEKISDFYNMIFIKGAKAEKVLASLQAETLSDLATLA